MKLNAFFHGRATHAFDFSQRLQFVATILVFDLEGCDVFVGSITAGFVYKVAAFTLLAFSDEFVAVLTADIAIIGRHDVDRKTEFGKDSLVGLPHLVVRIFKLRFGAEAVSILHNKFADTQQTTAGAHFVAELHAELVDVKR